MSSHSLICLETQFKQRLTHLKSAIQNTLGVGVSTTHSYDILAVSQGFSDYQSAKGRAQMPYYAWGLNIGTDQEPYFVTQAIGHHRNADEARIAGSSLLLGSPKHVKWVLFENGEQIALPSITHKSGPAWDLCRVHDSLLLAVHHNVSEIRLRKIGDNSIVDYQTRTGWVNGTVLSGSCSNDVSGVMSQLKELASQNSNAYQSDVLFFDMPTEDYVVHVKARIVRASNGDMMNIRLYDPREQRYHGALLEGCPAFRQLRIDVNNEKNGLFLIVGRTGSGRTTTYAYLMSQLNVAKPKNASNTAGTDGLSLSELQKRLIHADADIVSFGEIINGNNLSTLLDTAKSKPVVALLHSSDSGALSRLQAMGADMQSVHEVLRGLYSQCLMRSIDKSIMIPVSSYQRLDNGERVGPSLFEEARILHLRGGVSDREMHNHFGESFESLIAS